MTIDDINKLDWQAMSSTGFIHRRSKDLLLLVYSILEKNQTTTLQHDQTTFDTTLIKKTFDP